ncbi:MAG: hypothetical protein J5766_03860, partial [Clostridia bacterium]|nr:hypothetical protein [Clostridia bacterium]
NDIERIFKGPESIRSQGQTCMILGFYCIILGILSLIFGIVSYNKGYKKGICTSAIILGIVTIVFSIVLMAMGSQTISSTYG